MRGTKTIRESTVTFQQRARGTATAPSSQMTTGGAARSRRGTASWPRRRGWILSRPGARRWCSSFDLDISCPQRFRVRLLEALHVARRRAPEGGVGPVENCLCVVPVTELLQHPPGGVSGGGV